jgi:CRP-like cAMP-binding protein
LFKSGDPGNALFVVLTGGLEVVLGSAPNETVVATVSPGQIVGELEVMTSSLRVATLRATDTTLLLELSAQQLDQLLKENRPEAVKLVSTIAKTLARRLAAVNQRIVARPPQAAAAVPKGIVQVPTGTKAALPPPGGKAPLPPGGAPRPVPVTAPVAAAQASGEPEELAEADVVMDDDDLAVLDKLWS